MRDVERPVRRAYPVGFPRPLENRDVRQEVPVPRADRAGLRAFHDEALPGEGGPRLADAGRHGDRPRLAPGRGPRRVGLHLRDRPHRHALAAVAHGHEGPGVPPRDQRGRLPDAAARRQRRGCAGVRRAAGLDALQPHLHVGLRSPGHDALLLLQHRLPVRGLPARADRAAGRPLHPGPGARTLEPCRLGDARPAARPRRLVHPRQPAARQRGGGGRRRHLQHRPHRPAARGPREGPRAGRWRRGA